MRRATCTVKIPQDLTGPLPNSCGRRSTSASRADRVRDGGGDAGAPGRGALREDGAALQGRLRGGAQDTGGRYGTKGQEMETRILLVEDNESFRQAFARMLELELDPELNVTFAQADSLDEAHTLLQQEDGLDAALIDIGLPDGDGLDLVRELEGDGDRIPALPTLVITADLEHSVATRAIEAGARGVLSKMVSLGETVEAVQMLIGARSSTGGAPGLWSHM